MITNRLLETLRLFGHRISLPVIIAGIGISLSVLLFYVMEQGITGFRGNIGRADLGRDEAAGIKLGGRATWWRDRARA